MGEGQAERERAPRGGLRKEGGRAAQRRRTRAHILDAASRLVASGQRPSIDDVAAAADVSRRTVYLHFPTLDQLLLDATAGLLSRRTEEAVLDPSADAPARVDALVRSIVAGAEDTLPLGRKIIALTVDAAGPQPDGPRRGYRRITWLEQALEPARDRLSAEQFSRLVASLAVVVGWEAMIVLRDLCGLPPDREEQVLRWAAQTLVEGMLREEPLPPPPPEG